VKAAPGVCAFDDDDYDDYDDYDDDN